MAAGPSQLPPTPPFSCSGQRRQLRGGSAVHVSRRTKYSKVLLSDAALEVKKFSWRKTQLSYQILGILCEIPGGVSLSFNVCLHAVIPLPCTPRNKKSHFSRQTTL